MSKQYCLDTSGLSNPLLVVPPDIFVTLWVRVCAMIQSGIFAVTPEIYAEMALIRPQPIRDCVAQSKQSLLHPLFEDAGLVSQYTARGMRMQEKHASYIAQYRAMAGKTVSLIDMTIIALAKHVNLPLISMERAKGENSLRNKSIPDICEMENIEHLTFNNFLRREGVKI